MSEIESVSKEESDRIDAALGLKMVSIRLPERLIEDFKLLAGKGPYQALMRQTLVNHAADMLIDAGRGVLQGQKGSV